MSIRIGILGYGNLGRGIECAVKHAPDMELKAVFTRRNPADVKILNDDVKVYHIDEALKMADRIVVMENNGRIKNIFSNPNKQDKNKSSDKELLLKLMDIMMC